MDQASAMRQAYELISAGDWESFGALIADDFVEHEDLPPGIPPTKEGVLQYFAMARAGFPDLRFEPEFVLVEGDKAVAYYRFTGTQSGEFMGIPPTGMSVDVRGVDIIRWGDDGLGHEHWGVFDAMTMMQQLGVVPQGPPA